jgi:hypothetical protein
MPPAIRSISPFSSAGMMSLPFVDPDLRLDAHVGGYLPGYIHLETRQFAGIGAHGPGGEQRHADSHRSTLQYQVERIGVGAGRQAEQYE